MNAQHLAFRLIVDGYVVVPDVIAGADMEDFSDAFESHAGKIGTRHMDFAGLAGSPRMLARLCPPKMMDVVDAFYAHYSQTTAFACCSGIRDIFDPAKYDASQPWPDYSDLSTASVGWHDDVQGVKEPSFRAMSTSLSSLIYLDETFADNGAYVTAVGTHHLANPGEGDRPILSPSSLVREHAELRHLPVKPGSAIIHRAHNWHGVVSARQRRRVMIHTFIARELYFEQPGHTVIEEEHLEHIPAERHKYIVRTEPAAH